MKILFFDTETNGLPKDWKASYTEVDNWPRVIQLAWIVVSITPELQVQTGPTNVHLVKPDGWLPGEFAEQHGLTLDRLEREGKPIAEVIELFQSDLVQCQAIGAHNLQFDHRITWAEVIRLGKEPNSGMIKLCTMMKSTGVCKIPGKRGFKWPTLAELHQFLFNKGFDGAHDAASDIEATVNCFGRLLHMGVFPEVVPSIVNNITETINDPFA